MPAEIDNLVTEVSEEVTIMASATTLINGFQARVDAAVNAAIAGGATAAQLQVLTQLQSDLNANGDALAAAVQANTPTA